MTATSIAPLADGRLHIVCHLDKPGLLLGWQLHDPDTGLFIQEGEWKRAEQSEVALDIDLPPEHGRYRVYVSPVDADRGWAYAHGERFLVLDAECDSGGAHVVRSRTTTLRRLRWERLPSALARVFREPLVAIWENRALIRSMARRDIMARYRGSFGDVLWTVLYPLLMMVTYFFVFGIVLRTRFAGDPTREGFVLYFLAGMLPWLAFAEPVGRAPNVIPEHRNFVKKLVFPVGILPVAQVISGLVTGLFAMLVFVVGLLVTRGSIPLTVAWLPVLIVPQVMFTLGVAWTLAAIGVFARDLSQINSFLLTLWMFLTPIFYPEASLPPESIVILRKNPLFVLVKGYRAIFLESTPPPLYPTLKLWAVALIVFFAGYALFYKLRKSFADVI